MTLKTRHRFRRTVLPKHLSNGDWLFPFQWYVSYEALEYNMVVNSNRWIVKRTWKVGL